MYIKILVYRFTHKGVITFVFKRMLIPRLYPVTFRLKICNLILTLTKDSLRVVLVN